MLWANRTHEEVYASRRSKYSKVATMLQTLLHDSSIFLTQAHADRLATWGARSSRSLQPELQVREHLFGQSNAEFNSRKKH